MKIGLGIKIEDLKESFCEYVTEDPEGIIEENRDELIEFFIETALAVDHATSGEWDQRRDDFIKELICRLKEEIGEE